ncbi:MAG: hypothetical protein ACOYBY_04500 [Dermatophilaceae bacterium]
MLRDDDAALNLAVKRVLLGHSLIAGFGGVPVVWMGDELGTPNDPFWDLEPGHQDDNRWVHRPRMDWECAARRAEADTVEGRLFAGVSHIAAVRAQLAHLHGFVPSEVLGPWDPGVLVLARRHPLGTLLCAYNVTPTWRPLPGWVLREHELAPAVDALTGIPVEAGTDDNAWLAPYAAWWLLASPSPS